MEKKKLNKTTKSNLITYGMVLAAYLIVQGMIAGNLLSNLMQGLKTRCLLEWSLVEK